MHNLETQQPRLLNGLARRCAKALRAGAMVVGGVLLAASMAHAGFENGGFEDGNFNHWTVKSYTRGTGTPLPANSTAQDTNNRAPLTVFPPAQESDLRLLLDTQVSIGVAATLPGNPIGGAGVTTGNRAQIMGVLGTLPNSITAANAPNLKLPRWGERTIQVGGNGGRKASSIEQTATMAKADVDPIDGKIHVRFAIAPVLNDPSHPGANQPFFYIRVYNETKNKELFSTFNFSNQPGIPWQVNGNYKYTDWQGFDISPGNGSLDEGDEVTLRIYVSNCSDGGADHTAVVYLDAVGAFMPGLSVAATGPSNTKPGEQITYTYNYVNNSGVYALGSKVYVAAPMVAGKQAAADPAGAAPMETIFAGTPSGPNGPCDGPHPGIGISPYKRGDYYICDVGDLNDGQSGSFNVTFQVPAGAPTVAPYNFINNGDYNISANAVSPYIGPLVKTNILGAADPVVDLGVTIDNGGAISYPPGTTLTTPITVTVSNLSATDSPNSTVSQTLAGLTSVTWTCDPAPGSTATCGAASGNGSINDHPNLPAGQGVIYTITGTTGAAGTPVSTAVTVTPPAGTSDSQLSNNTAGLSAPVGTQHNVTANATGAGAGHILAVPSGLVCGDASTACSTTGTTKPVAEGDEVRLTPVAHAGSIFKGWTGCTSTSGNVCVITVGTTDVTATANFAKAYIVTPAVDPAGGGSIGPTTPQQVEEGGSKVFTLNPDPGKYPVIKPPAAGAACTGTLSGNTYTVNPVTADCGFTVEFVTGVTLTSSVTGGNGTITPRTSEGPLPPGNNSTVYDLTPGAGYTPVVGGTCSGTLSGNTYTVTNAASDCTVIASFTNDPVTVTSSVNGGNGSIDTTGTVNLPRGGKRTYTFTPNAGYYPLVTGNCPGTLVGNTYTVDPVNADCAFAVAFINQTVDITATVTGGTGTITPPGTTKVAQGGGQTYTATPGGGNVVVFGGNCPGTRTGDTFTVANAQTNCSVDVKFVAAADAVTVTTSVPGGNGTVTTPGQNAAGETVLGRGDARVWTVTPTPGYVPRLLPGSTCTGTLSASAPYTYTVPSAADCTANFAFAAAAAGNVASIPTLSEWGLIILSALMALFALGMRRRQMP